MKLFPCHRRVPFTLRGSKGYPRAGLWLGRSVVAVVAAVTAEAATVLLIRNQ